MIHLTKQSIQQHFLAIGYSPLDYIYLDDLQKAMIELNEQQFDKQTLEQLVDQCKTNSKGQLKIQDFILTILKAQQILVQRDKQIKQLISKHESTLRQQSLSGIGGSASSPGHASLLQVINQLKQQSILNNLNLQTIYKAFNRKQKKDLIKLSSIEQQYAYEKYGQNQQFQIPCLVVSTMTFTWILELIILLTIIMLPIMLHHNTYINITLFAFILLNLFSGHFCKTIIRIWAFLMLFTIIVDLIWFIIAAKSFWDPHYFDWPHKLYPFLRLNVILSATVTIGKVILFILLISEYNTDQSQKKKISVFGFYTFQLSHDDKIKNFFPTLNRPSNYNQYDNELQH